MAIGGYLREKSTGKFCPMIITTNYDLKMMDTYEMPVSLCENLGAYYRMDYVSSDYYEWSYMFALPRSISGLRMKSNNILFFRYARSMSDLCSSSSGDVSLKIEVMKLTTYQTSATKFMNVRSLMAYKIGNYGTTVASRTGYVLSITYTEDDTVDPPF